MRIKMEEGAPAFPEVVKIAVKSTYYIGCCFFLSIYDNKVRFADFMVINHYGMGFFPNSGSLSISAFFNALLKSPS